MRQRHDEAVACLLVAMERRGDEDDCGEATETVATRQRRGDRGMAREREKKGLSTEGFGGILCYFELKKCSNSELL
jgi:hypothetical protein